MNKIEVTSFCKKYFKKIYTRMAEDTEAATYQIIPFSILAACSFPIFYFLNKYLSNDAYENIWLRALASLLCLPLFFFHYWPQKAKIFLPLYWYSTLFYVLPFFFIFFFLMNGASPLWFTNIMIMVLFLVLLVDWLSVIVLLLLGAVFAFFCYYLNVEQIQLPNSFYSEILLIIGFVFISVLLSRSKSKLEAEKFEALNSFSAMVAHELRTPLSTIRNGVEGIKTYLPDLLDAYKKAKEANLTVEHIRKDQLVSLEKCVNNLESESSLANITINMLLTNVRQSKLAPTEISVFSAAALLEQALQRYPLPTEQRVLIHSDNEHDFMIQGDRELLIHVIFNLLKNALYFIEAAQKGEIMLWFDSDEKFNRIHFKDTGQGIAPDDLPHIFDRFYTRRYHGTGIGLAFCKTVMHLHKGDIICQSVLGEYADFIISFPKKVQEQK